MIFAAYEEKRRGFGDRWEWQVEELRLLLESVVAEVAKKRELTLFVDALDEAVDEKGDKAAEWLLDFFHGLNDSVVPEEGSLGGLKICVSCRHYPVVKSFGEGAVIQVEKENGIDVWKFVHDKIQRGVAGWEQEPREVRQKLVDTIAKKADGVFLWASLRVPKIVRSLNDGDISFGGVEAMLEAESNDLFPLYELIFENEIQVKHQKKALLFLQWVCFAERPMTLTELRFAMACDDGDTPWLRRSCEESEHFVASDKQMEKLTKSLSGGLVEVRSHDKGTTIQFIHETVNEFLHVHGIRFLASKGTQDPAIYETRIVGQSQSRLTRCCINYLRMDSVAKEVGQWLDGDDKQPRLLEYATKCWNSHAEKAEGNGVPQEHIAHLFQSTQGVFEAWVRSFNKMDHIHKRCPTPGSNLIHVASASNLQSLVDVLLQRGIPVDTRDEWGETALHKAAERGLASLASLLLAHHADVNAKSLEKRTPLERAAANGHEIVAKALLARGADINIMSTSIWGGALHGAASSGALSLVRFLLDNGADINAQSRGGGSALQQAVENNHGAVVRLLISKGANVNAASCGPHGNALYTAASPAREEICRILLDAGADVNAPGGQFGYALHAAVQKNNGASLVRLLLDRGAKTDVIGGEVGTALHAAALNPDNEEIIQILLDRGADVNSRGGIHDYVYLAAACSGSVENVRILIAHGAQTDVDGGIYGNALQAACTNSNTDLVRYFLDIGLDVNQNGGEYGTSVCAAMVALGSGPLVDLLLEYGAEVNALVPNFGTVLNAAVYWQKTSCVRKLLAHGADVRCNEKYGCPLERAASKGNVDIMSLLLEHGAEVNCLAAMSGGFRTSALQNAAGHGHKKAVELLLDNGADINFQSSSHSTALQGAIRRGHIPVAKLLLDRGADPNLPGSFSLEIAQGNKTMTNLLLDRGARSMPGFEGLLM